MPYAVAKYVETPNPHALKCMLAHPLPAVAAAPAVRSYASPAAASSDPAAAAILAVPGVRTVLIADAWLTVNKDPQATWKAIKPGLESALKGLA